MTRHGDILTLGAVGLLVAAGSVSANASGSRAKPTMPPVRMPDDWERLVDRYGGDTDRAASRAISDQRNAWMKQITNERPELFEDYFFVELNDFDNEKSFFMDDEYPSWQAANAAGEDLSRKLEAETGAHFWVQVYEKHRLRRHAFVRTLSGRIIEVDPWEGITPEEETMWEKFVGEWG